MSDTTIAMAGDCLQQLSLEFEKRATYGSRIYDFFVPKCQTYIDFIAQDVINRTQFPTSGDRPTVEAGFRVILISFNVTEADRPILLEFIRRAFVEQNHHVVLSKPTDKLIYRPIV